MIQTISISIIRFYQLYISSALKSLLGYQAVCRFTPSCSDYATEAIRKEGVFIGCFKFLVRLLHCQPYTSAKNWR